MKLPLDQRPVLVALAGPNGAGKTTFYHSHLAPVGLRLLNADILARELQLDPYTAARAASALRTELCALGESFVFETVFSDPVGDKLEFLKECARTGYNVVLCFVGISGPAVSEERVAMRVTQGGHDVPGDKLVARYPRIVENLRRALLELPRVWIFDNNDLSVPFRLVAVFEEGRAVKLVKSIPAWLRPILPR